MIYQKNLKIPVNLKTKKSNIRKQYKRIWLSILLYCSLQASEQPVVQSNFWVENLQNKVSNFEGLPQLLVKKYALQQQEMNKGTYIQEISCLGLTVYEVYIQGKLQFPEETQSCSSIDSRMLQSQHSIRGAACLSAYEKQQVQRRYKMQSRFAIFEQAQALFIARKDK